MYKVFSGANGEYVAFEEDDGSHAAPASFSREANQGWGNTQSLKRQAAQLNAGDEEVNDE